MLCFIALKDLRFTWEVTMQVKCDTGKTILHCIYKQPVYYRGDGVVG